MRIGVIVNPDAGLGGKLGFKGSDGRAEEARLAGAVDRSGPRVFQALEKFSKLIAQRPVAEQLTLVVWADRMGAEWVPQSPNWRLEVVGEVGESTTARDTIAAVSGLISSPGGVDLLVYGGGDGTTRDIVSALAELEQDGVKLPMSNSDESPQNSLPSKLPILGIPGGVKMHSGCFAATPNAAAEVIRAYLDGDLRPASTEVMDLDEQVYRKGEWRVRMYGEAMTPSSPVWMQGAKEQVRAADESEVIEALADHVKMLIESKPNLQIIWGSGGTLREVARLCGFQGTLLGIDISTNVLNANSDDSSSQFFSDLNESQLLDKLQNHSGENLLLLSPMGGQGFLIGRGNLQLSAQVLKLVGLDNILGVVTPSKLLGLASVRIDTGDVELDQEFQERKYVKLLQGFRTTRIMRIAKS